MGSDTDNNLDDLTYLSPGFDLNSLTVPRIRSILVGHDVSYPASAKKAQLIKILEDEVLPRAKKLLRDRERVRRTSEGITDMPSSQDTTTGEDEDRADSMPPPPTPSTVRRGRSRQSTRASTTDTEQGTAPPSERRGVKTSAVKHPRASDTETGDDTAEVDATPRRSTGRKSRKSETFPTPRASTVGDGLPFPVKSEGHDDSVFTDDNPFQSGSSPMEREPQRARTVSRDQRRKSGMRHSADPVMASDERRKRRSEPLVSKVKQEDGIEVPTRSTFDIPLAKLMTPKVEEPDGEEIEAGEEFTPEEQLALERERARDRKWNATRPGPRRRQPTQGRISRSAPWVVILIILSSFGAWWRKEKIEIGYCGVGKPHWSLTTTDIPDWVDSLGPQCEPCPQHADCYTNFEATCEPGFVLKQHPLSLGGLVPVPPTCEPDGEKVRRVRAVADRAIEELRERRARWECGESGKEDGKQVPSADMTASELKQEVSKLRRRGMTDEEFEDLWKGAIGEITGREEVITSTRGPSGALTLSSTSLARLSLACAVRRYLRLSLLAYRFPLLLLGLSLIVAVYARSQVLARRSDIARVPSLVGMTLDRLATQAALHARGEAPEEWIAVGQLRDDILRHELKSSRREELWKRVRNIIEGNANVRASLREGRTGDMFRVWEWIGGIGGLGGEWDSAGKRRETKVRFSLSPSETSGPAEDGTKDVKEMRKWDEGRPVY